MDARPATYAPVPAEDLAWLGTDPVPAAAYYDPAWYELEGRAVFERTWLQIGHICEIPEAGSYIVRPVEIAKASILIVRGKDGVIRAFHNVCAHRGTLLVSEDQGQAGAFTCRYHAWTYGYDGQLRSAPDFEQFYVDKAACGLKPVAVDVCGGLIFINLDPEPRESLREFLAGFAEPLDGLPMARATHFTEYGYEIEANWKVNYDNFQENYHLRFIHPKTGAAARGEDNPFGYPTRYTFTGSHRSQALWRNPEPPPASATQVFAFTNAYALAAQDGMAGEKVDMKIFPNLFIIGQPGYIFSHCVTPLAPDRCRGTIRVYWRGEDDTATRRFTREYLMATLRDVHAEDRQIIARGQQGLSSGALTHIHFQLHESLCRHLFNEVNARVEAYKAERADAAGAD